MSDYPTRTEISLAYAMLAATRQKGDVATGWRMSPKVAILKPLSSALSIGTGGPFGAEGPIIMTGGAIGSLFAQCFHMSAAERKTLLVAGAAAGMTAIFGSPIAAVTLAVSTALLPVARTTPTGLTLVTRGGVR